MKLKRIVISDFKMFQHLEFDFHDQFTLIIGGNGSGKSSILNAASVALGAWSRAYMSSDQGGRSIQKNEVRQFQSNSQTVSAPEVSISAEGQAHVIDNENKVKFVSANWQCTWTKNTQETELSGSFKYHTNQKIYGPYPLAFSLFGKRLFAYQGSGHSFDLPLIAFYGCDRIWFDKNQDVKESLESSATAKYENLDAYADCFHAGTSEKGVTRWLIKHSLASSQKQSISPTLQAVKNAAKAALEHCADIYYDFEQSRVIIVMEDGTQIAYEHLSEGQRTLIGLFCDIARRASILNPHLGELASEKTQGVVLIDELDLHLHPNWQRKIIESLRRIFPCIQFICSTHSPFLIQSLRSGDELRILSADAPQASISNTAHKSLEDIASGLMGVNKPAVSQLYEAQRSSSEQIIRLLNDESRSPQQRLARYKELLAQSADLFASNPALQASLEVNRVAKLGEAN